MAAVNQKHENVVAFLLKYGANPPTLGICLQDRDRNFKKLGSVAGSMYAYMSNKSINAINNILLEESCRAPFLCRILADDCDPFDEREHVR
jgi:hypothetical protein